MYSLALSLLLKRSHFWYTIKMLQKYRQAPEGRSQHFSLWFTFVWNTLVNIHSDIFLNVFIFRKEVKLVPENISYQEKWSPKIYKVLLPVCSSLLGGCTVLLISLYHRRGWMKVNLHKVRLPDSVLCGASTLE